MFLPKRVLTVVFLLSLCGAAHAVIRSAGSASASCTNPLYPTVSAAIPASSPGDGIVVCPGVYMEQLVIGFPLTLRGLPGTTAVIQPPGLKKNDAISAAAAIIVAQTSGVTISDLTVDVSNNVINGCDLPLAGILFQNSSGRILRSTIFGAQLKSGRSCSVLFPGNGFGIEIQSDGSDNYSVTVDSSNIHDFGRDGILATGDRLAVAITGNVITGRGPASGDFQFGVFLANGVRGLVAHNTITQANCGSLPIAPCADLRSEGIVLRRVADGTVVQDNQINNVQAGIFINGGSDLHIIGNTITSVDALSAIHLMGATDSTLDSNRIFNVGPIDSQASLNQEGCGINSVPGTGNARNLHSNNLVSNAYCGIAYSPTDQLTGNIFTNTLYQSFDSSLYAKKYPPVP